MALQDTDFEIQKGCTFSFNAIASDENDDALNLTGYTAVMKIRSGNDSTSPLLETCTVTIPSPLTGTLVVDVPASTTAAFTWEQGFYDLVIVSGSGTKTKLLKGRVYVNPSVSV